MNLEALIQYFHYIIIPGGPVPNPTKGKRSNCDFLNISYNFGCSSMGFRMNHMTKTSERHFYSVESEYSNIRGRIFDSSNHTSPYIRRVESVLRVSNIRTFDDDVRNTY